jgi:GntR family transcriptional regulator/MocR family aminotransferase
MEPGRPDLRAFPRREWLRALAAAAQTASYAELDYPEPGGTERLRAVLAGYLNRVRGAAIEPGSVHVCFGAAQGMLRICSALRASGHTAIAVEDPGPTRLWQAARIAGLTLVPVPVDGDGMVVSTLDGHPEVRAVCVGAAHQCPLGPALAPHRRAWLLDWARRVDGLIVEDDWDAEFRYDRPAVATVQGMQPHRVALLGSVSRALGPSVGIGWVVAPPQWTVTLHGDDRLLLMPPVLNQLALAAMLESGAYDRHLRASRSRFRARRGRLLQALERIPGCTVRGADAGLHVLLDLPADCDPAAVVASAYRRGLQISGLDDFRIRPNPDAAPALVLGYGNLADAAVEEAADVLRRTIRAVRGGARDATRTRGATRQSG